MKQLLSPLNLYNYQREAIRHQLMNPKSMLWLGCGLGKEQPDSEPVLTPYGWQCIDQLLPGDYVIGQNGQPTEVEAVFPQGVKEVLKVTFNDGSFTHCGWDHLWNVRTDKDRNKNNPFRTMTIRDIVDSGLTSINRTTVRGHILKWSIPMVEPVNHCEKDLQIDPYVFGVLLGDGNGVEMCTDIETIIKCGLKVSKPHETSSYTGYAYVSGIKQKMRDMGVLTNRSWEKFVPLVYMNGSIDQRLSLLQGLLDTDGSPIGGGGVEFSSTSEQLTDAVVELAESLGGIGRKKGPRTTRHQNGEGRPSWRVNVKLPSQFNPFTLKRKLNKWQRPTKYHVMRKIQSVDVVREESSRCIRVKADDNLYVTRHHIVTHNTPITLTTIVDRMNAGQVKKTLIFGPLRVIQAVWAREARKWEHTKHLRFSVLHGNAEKRSRALFADADVYLCNYENMNWLTETLLHYYIDQKKPLPFEFVVYDEVSKLKNANSMRMSGGNVDATDAYGVEHVIKKMGWKKIIPHVQYATGLTGSPASNGYIDLHGQYLAIDNGDRLGKFITHFRQEFFQSDHMGWSHTVTDGGKSSIEKKISDITVKMDSREYLDLPDCTTSNMFVKLPPKARKAYEEVEKDLFTALDDGSEIELFSKSSVSNKCLQFCNGSPYLQPESPEYRSLHNAKLDALKEIIDDAAGRPVLCSYSFKADAERIMKKFNTKKFRCVNMTETKSADTEKIIDDWNDGRVKLMIGHPACLSADTLVLTELNGWVRIVDVKDDDRVHDGVEFVSHNGCSYSGLKTVIDVFGVTMTPNHKLLINDEWVEADNVENTEEVRQKALYKYKGNDPIIGSMFTVRNTVRNSSSERGEAQSKRTNPLQTLYKRQIPQHDGYTVLADMAGNDSPFERHNRQGLRGTRYRSMPRMGAIRKISSGHVRRLSRTFNNRTNQREQGLQQTELHMGDFVRTARQQTKQPTIDVSGRKLTLSRSMSSVRCQQNEINTKTEQRNDSRRSRERRNEFTIREKQQPEKQIASREAKNEHVYDLVDCGPRNRFLIKNGDDDVFISHNSMGHGIDGLQENGCIMVWFGCNWSLELYEQMNQRLDRQGQTRPVSIIRILAEDTVDLAVVDALERKDDDQSGLKNALQRYRNGVTTNELEYSFF